MFQTNPLYMDAVCLLQEMFSLYFIPSNTFNGHHFNGRCASRLCLVCKLFTRVTHFTRVNIGLLFVSV